MINCYIILWFLYLIEQSISLLFLFINWYVHDIWLLELDLYDKLIQKLTKYTKKIGANWTHGMSFVSLNQINPGLISHWDMITLQETLLSGAWESEWLFPVWCSLINWWSCKILQITPSSQKLVPSSALIYPTYVCSLSTSFTVCVRPAECTTHYCCGLFLWFLCNFVSWPHELTLVVSGRGHQHYILAPSGCHITMSVCQSVAQICLEHSISDLQVDIDFQSNIITIQSEPITLLSWSPYNQ